MSIIIQLISMIFVLIAFFQQVIASVEFSDGKKTKAYRRSFWSVVLLAAAYITLTVAKEMAM